MTEPWKPRETKWISGQNRSIHHLKCHPELFDAVADGSKKAEFRSTKDRVFSVGDVLVLYKLNSKGEVEEFSPTMCCLITHVQRVFLPDDYAMLSVGNVRPTIETLMSRSED